MKKRLQLLDRHKAAMRNRKRKIFAGHRLRKMVVKGHHVFTFFDDVGSVPAYVWAADLAEFRASESRAILAAHGLGHVNASTHKRSL